MRLSDHGGRVLRQLGRGEPIGSSEPVRRLARRLLATGMAHPVPPTPAPCDITVVIPVRDDQRGLDETATGLGELPLVVVDDGSAERVTVPRRATLERRTGRGSPAAARNTGLALASSSLVAFVDAGVVVGRSQLEALASHFVDPAVVAAAPRIRSAPDDTVVGRYEQRHSPLDMGADPGRAKPGSRISYVPTTCLIARRSALEHVAVDGRSFDEQLRYGEDVDLVWRLAEIGDVRYDPSVEVTHPPRASRSELARQRYRYGTAAGPLGVLHGAAVAPLRISPWSAIVVAAGVARRPVAAVIGAGASAALLRRKLPPELPDRTVEATMFACRGHLHAATSVADALWRTWWPISLVGLAARSMRGPILVALAVSLFRRVDRRRRWHRELPVAMIDDLSYGLGVWVGAARRRSPWPVVPVFGRWR